VSPMANGVPLARAWTGRALLACGLLAPLLVAPPARAGDSGAPSAADKAKAKRSFDRGQKLYGQHKLDEAMAAFQASHDSVADAKASLMIARILRDNGELLKARNAYQSALDEAMGAEARGQGRRATIDEIKKDLKDLDGVLGFVNVELVHAPSGTRVSIDGRDVTAQLGSPIRVEPGPLVVSAGAPGSGEKTQKVTVKAGETTTVELSFTWSGKTDEQLADVPPDSDDHPASGDSESDDKPASKGKRTLTWIAGGVGLAGFATFAVFGAMSTAKFNHLEDACPDQHCPPDLESDRNTGKTFQTVANVGLVVGAVGVGTAVTLFALGGPSDSSTATGSRVPRLELGLGSLRLRGSFE
jgi:hypothetical protein